VRTVVISDLHLGSRARRDLLRRPALRDRLMAVIEGADELVVLGDALELREVTLEDGLAVAGPFLEDAAEALGGGRVVLVPGNHDHGLAEPVVRAAGRAGLGLERRVPPPSGGPLERLARRLGGTTLELVYPGVWIRPAIYATHGHYLDLHNAVPTLEMLAVALSARLDGGPPGPGARPGDYEAAIARAYGPILRLGQATPPARAEAGADLSLRAWQKLTTDDPSASARLVTEILFPRAVAGVNRLGLGPFVDTLSGEILRRAGLEAIGEVVDRLGIEADWVLFGHTHRSGPWPGRDDPREWTVRGGTRLVNTGSWVYQPGFLPEAVGGGPYWPGVVAEIEDDGPPVLRALLEGTGHDDLRA
jgi:hypothetical protein